MNNNISIFVNGVKLERFLEITANVDSQNIGGTFIFSSIDKQAANVASRVVIKCGGQTFMSGFILKKSLKFTKTGGSVWEFSGVDRLGFLGNCQFSKHAYFQNKSALEIARAVIADLENCSDYQIEEIRQSAIDEFEIFAGESIGGCLGKISALAGKFVYTKPRGAIEFAKAGAASGSVNLTVGQSEIREISIEENIEGCASVILGRTDIDGTEDTPRYKIMRPVNSFPSRDSVYMPNYLCAAKKGDLENIVQRRYEETISALRTLKIECAGCLNPDNGVWAVNSRVWYRDELGKTGFSGRYNLKAVEIKKSKRGGAVSTLTLSNLPLETAQTNAGVTTQTINDGKISGLVFTPVDEHKEAYNGGGR